MDDREWFEDRVQAAVSLLESIGATNMCLTTNPAVDLRLLPPCGAGDFRRGLATEGEEETIFYIGNICGALICVFFVAIIAGLFLGLLTLDELDLRIIQRTSLDQEEREYATALLPVVEDRHRVLVTLLLLNALAYETLPIFLDALVPSWAAILISTTFIMVFGEIIPSGIFMGPNQLYLGYTMLPLMRVFLFVMGPVAKPLARLLDYLTDPDGDGSPDSYNRGELSALIRIQHEERDDFRRKSRLNRVMKNGDVIRVKDQSWAAIKAQILEKVDEITDNAADEVAPPPIELLMPPLHKREVDLLEGALKMKTVLAMDVYTPNRQVYSVPDNLILDKRTITSIYSHGYARVPVYCPNPSDPDDTTSVLGFLITRQLMLIDWDHNRKLSTLPLQRPLCVSPRMNLVDLFDVLQKDGRLMTFVCARPDLANKAFATQKPIPVEAGMIGIVTLVDIMESILQDRIYDEGDMRERDRAVATLTRWAATKLQSFVVKTVKKRRQLSFSGTLNPASGDFGETCNASEATPLL